MSWLSRATGINVNLAKSPTGIKQDFLRSDIGKAAQLQFDPLGLSDKKKTPSLPTPEASPEAAQVLSSQQQAYKDYMSRLPSFQKKMAEGLAQQSMGQLSQTQRGLEQRNVSRGMGYGALNEAMKEQAKSQAQQQLASSIQQGNLGLLGLGEQMQSGIVQTGAGMQSDLQNRMNQIYAQQQAQLQAQNQQAGNVLGLIGQAGIMAALV